MPPNYSKSGCFVWIKRKHPKCGAANNATYINALEHGRKRRDFVEREWREDDIHT